MYIHVKPCLHMYTYIDIYIYMHNECQQDYLFVHVEIKSAYSTKFNTINLRTIWYDCTKTKKSMLHVLIFMLICFRLTGFIKECMQLWKTYLHRNTHITKNPSLPVGLVLPPIVLHVDREDTITK